MPVRLLDWPLHRRLCNWNYVLNLSCFDCKAALKSEPELLQSGDWIVNCQTCGVINKLTPHATEPNQFWVTGMIINFRRDK